jgi:hypothetical protein
LCSYYDYELIVKMDKELIESAFYEYLDKMAEYCPYLMPAKNSQNINNIFFDISEKDRLLIENGIFWESVRVTEKFRKVRQDLDTPNKILLNFNLIFLFESEILNILDWPHYLLKVLYTEVGIVFGKFQKGKSGDNFPLPQFQFTHLSIRSAVKKKDERFFNKAPYLLEHMLLNEDKGQNILLPIIDSDICELSVSEKIKIYSRLRESYSNLLVRTEN